MAGIYIHIPFCKQACHYCDFHFSTSQGYRWEMGQALMGELVLRKDFLGDQPVDTIYFGGGTPSLLDGLTLDDVMDTIHRSYKVSEGAEITLEANPDDIVEEKLHVWKQLGVNRLSIGIQSFRNEVLKWMNRAHNSHQAFAAMSKARKAGFDNISLDLMYGLPVDHGPEGWLSDLDNAMRWNPEHISAYHLTIEGRTLFKRKVDQGHMSDTDPDQAAEDFLLMRQRLFAEGYDHYEVSNLCLPGKESRHNSSYWSGTPYLGIGPSAHSYDGAYLRWANLPNNAEYMRQISAGKLPGKGENLSKADVYNESVLLGLRQAQGIDLQAFAQRHGRHLMDLDAVHDYIDKEYLDEWGGRLKPTEKGLLIADEISANLFMEG